MAKRVTKGNLWGFIQSRPYVSVADIRRLFMIDVDSAAALPTGEGRCYIGLTQDAADLLRQLWSEGRIVLDLNPDVKAKVVQGVYPARAPLSRPATSPSASRHGRGEMPSVVAGKRQEGNVSVADEEVAEAVRGAGNKRRRRRRRGGRGGAGTMENGAPPPVGATPANV